MANTLIEFSNELWAITADFNPYVVSVRARRGYPSSGIRWTSNAVVTPDHAIHRDEDISVTLPSGESVAATLIGRDPGTDLAVLKVETAGPAAIDRRAAEQVKVGEAALVLGRSPNSGINASFGIISAASGPWRTWRGGQLDSYIRLDAKLFPQSSGGAVVNMRGEVVGVASPALSRIAGLAIPIATVKRVAEKLIERGFVPRGYLGIGAQPIAFSDDLRQQLSIANQHGLILLTVEPNGPAHKAGLLIGDILIAAGGQTIERIGDLQAFCDSGIIGKTANIKFIRGGAVQELPITAGERPNGKT